MIALNFDDAVFDRAAGATGLFELGGEGFEIISGEGEVFDEGDGFAAAAFGFAVEVGGLLVRREGAGGG